MVKLFSNAARALTTAASALALAVGALTLAPAPTLADDTVPSQEYFSYYYLDSAREKGFTGKGVTIALIDGEVDTSAPELAGATVIDKTPCTVTSGPTPRATARPWPRSWSPKSTESHPTQHSLPTEPPSLRTGTRRSPIAQRTTTATRSTRPEMADQPGHHRRRSNHQHLCNKW